MMDMNANALGGQAPPDMSGGAPPDPNMDPSAAMPQDPSQAPPGAAPAGAPPNPGDLHAQYDKLMQAADTLSTTKDSLDALMSLGDTVTPEDVVREVGLLVGHGLNPTALATMLADMPQKGDLLSQWVQQQDQQVQQRVGQLAYVTNVVRHKLGVDALHGLMIHHAENAGSPDEAQPQAPDMTGDLNAG